MQNEPNDSLGNIEPSAAEIENQKRCLCPKCQSENTQKLEMAYLSGRFKGTPLASQIQPPKEPDYFPKWLEPVFGVVGLLLVWWYFGLFHGMPWTHGFQSWLVREADIWDRVMLGFSCATLYLVSASILEKIFERIYRKPLSNRVYEILASPEYKNAKDTWKFGFICHKCGHRFLIRPNP